MFSEVIGRDISILYRHEHVFVDQLLKPYGINKVQAEILLLLEENKDMTNLTQMNTHFLLNKASMSKNIKNLLQEGYLAICKNENDKRENLISLTEQGKQLLPQLKDVFGQWDKLMIENISTEDIEQLRMTLSTIAEKIRRVKDNK